MELPRNDFKHAIAAGRRQIGIWNSLASNLVTEILAGAGFDWILVDAEHGPNDPALVLGQLQAAKGGSAGVVVRVPWNDPVQIKLYLDIGVQSFMVPYVQSADEARRAVAATRYPPAGVRSLAGTSRATGFGRIPDYFRRAQDEICVIVQVESRTALDSLEAIAGTEGIDGVFIGPADLSASFGLVGQIMHPDVQAAIRGVPERCRRAGKPAGMLAVKEEDCRRYLDWGYTFLSVGSDLNLLSAGSDRLARTYKPELAKS